MKIWVRLLLRSYSGLMVFCCVCHFHKCDKVGWVCPWIAAAGAYMCSLIFALEGSLDEWMYLWTLTCTWLALLIRDQLLLSMLQYLLMFSCGNISSWAKQVLIFRRNFDSLLSPQFVLVCYKIRHCVAVLWLSRSVTARRRLTCKNDALSAIVNWH